tara:strand:+ start:893 stop:2236 length:1344 start_codon:yes stop_codon:yes gene_type:complete
MTNFLKAFVLINLSFLILNCSFKNTGYFDDRLEELEKEIAEKNSRLVFTKRIEFREEIKGNTQRKISSPITNKYWLQKNFTYNNYIPNLTYENKNELYYKSKKIGKNKFNTINSFFEPIVFDNNIFFYDPSGNIFSFSVERRKLIWKFNFYKKRYKEIPININLKISNNKLIVSDNLGYGYSLDVETGNLLWAKNYGVPFISSIKIIDNKVFLLNQDNKFYTINENNGEENLSLETFPSLLKTNQETSLSLNPLTKNLYFITSSGQLYSINYDTKNINWLLNISIESQSSTDLFFSSPLVSVDNKIFFSSSVFTYCIDARSGQVKWRLPFSTYIRPIVSQNYVFLASKDGFILNIDNETGKVLWSKNMYKITKKIKEKKVGFIRSLLLVSDQILVTTSKGYFIFLDYKNGNIVNYTRASKSGFFSNPILVNKKIYALDNKIRVLIFK